MTVEVMSNGITLDFGDYKQFKPPVIERYLDEYGTAIQEERLIKVNLDKVAKTRIKEGKDFLITNPRSVNKDKKTKAPDGIFSPKYGVTQFDDQLGTRDMYRCSCGEMAGAIHLDSICTKCETKVEFIDVDLTINGWIPLGDYMVINPSMYIHLQKLIGKTELNTILKVDISKMTGDGVINVDRTGKIPYAHIGMLEFAKNIDEILDFYLKKYPKRRDQYDLIKEYQDCIFTHHIPVYSAILRPRIESNEKIRSFKANTIYETIMKQYEVISMETDNMTAILPALFEIQNEYMELFEWLIDSYAGKKGLLRSQFGGIRIDYGARAVIVNGKNLAPDEVEIPYVVAVTFLELEIIFLLKELDNLTENEAYTILNNSLRKFNPKIYSLMTSIITKSKTPMHMLVNRPPSLSDRSIRLLRVARIKDDISDLTLSISPALLDGYAGDYDGDSLAQIPLKDHRLIKTFEPTLSPRYNYISRTNGRYSGRMLFIKDYIIILSELFGLGDGDVVEEE